MFDTTNSRENAVCQDFSVMLSVSLMFLLRMPVSSSGRTVLLKAVAWLITTDGGIGIVLQSVPGRNVVMAVYASEVHLAIGSAVAGGGVELIALQSVRFGEVAEFLRFRIEA